MPELPDITVYIDALRTRTIGATLQEIRIVHPFLLRSVTPSPSEMTGARIHDVFRMGKQIVFRFEGPVEGQDDYMLLHLMVAGRLAWHEPAKDGAKPRPPGKIGLAAFDFSSGHLIFTEAGTKKRAYLYLLRGKDQLTRFDRGGLDVLHATSAQFRQVLERERHTLKRCLTDPHLFSGIGNTYSDEILHRARLSPFKISTQLSDEEYERLASSCHDVLNEWTALLAKKTGTGFPSKVTAFHPEMAVHGKYGKPCPVCGTEVQHIVYAENECNYCPACQTEGRLLADRSLSRLLKDDWPSTVTELEELRQTNETRARTAT